MHVMLNNFLFFRDHAGYVRMHAPAALTSRNVTFLRILTDNPSRCAKNHL